MKKAGLILVFLITSLLCSCGDFSLEYAKVITMKKTQLNDTVKASVLIRNRSHGQVRMDFMPECDCTSVVPDCLVLKPHSRQKVMVSFPVNTIGYYERFVYLQVHGSDVPDTITIRGNVERKGAEWK